MSGTQPPALVRRLSDLRRADIALVGGKNASLGEMIAGLQDAGVKVPGGFATTSQAYWALLEANALAPRMAAKLAELKDDAANLAAVGAALRQMVLEAKFPPALSDAIVRAYREMGAPRVAVRSSATAEDLPEASFAGQLESFLNVRGSRALLEACRRCYASLFTDRAIVYRRTHGFDHMKIALSVGVQQMVRAERAGAGVMFSIDTETGFPRTVLINAAWGLGETVVQGTVDPDEYHVFKPLLGDPALKPIVGRKLGAKERKMTASPRHTIPGP
jgi:pyruvate,water dikinase